MCTFVGLTEKSKSEFRIAMASIARMAPLARVRRYALSLLLLQDSNILRISVASKGSSSSLCFLGNLTRLLNFETTMSILWYRR